LRVGGNDIRYLLIHDSSQMSLLFRANDPIAVG
jgi:hypothetical protein